MDMNANYLVHEWQPFQAFKPSPNNIKPVALVILNQPITSTFDHKLISLWRASSVRLCVDGGLNQLFKWQQRLLTIDNNNPSAVYDLQEIQNFYPDYICGDLDSVEPTILAHYQAMGSKQIKLSNQDLTDFDKALRFAVNCIRNGEMDPDLVDSLEPTEIGTNLKRIDFDQIYTICDFSGRVDHSISNMNTLYTQCLQPLQTFILSSESITFLLKKGFNVIYADSDFFPGMYCGFFPFGVEAVVSTYGLKWNVSGKKLRFGGAVSSSNEFGSSNDGLVISERERELIGRVGLKVDVARRHVIVETDQELVWTMSIKQ